ncbi:MAG: hypothetical protein U9R08_01475 [Nanoarchaeota archaeon]|nr:hypothetical protein [Nanoarchaeota archaeon]
MAMIDVGHPDMMSLYRGLVMLTKIPELCKEQNKGKNKKKSKKKKDVEPVRILDVGGGIGKIGFVMRYELNLKNWEYHNVDQDRSHLERSVGNTYHADRDDIDTLFQADYFHRCFYIFPAAKTFTSEDGQRRNIDKIVDDDLEGMSNAYFIPIFKQIHVLRKRGLLAFAHFDYMNFDFLFEGINNAGMILQETFEWGVPESCVSYADGDGHVPGVKAYIFRKQRRTKVLDKVTELKEMIKIEKVKKSKGWPIY